MKKIILFVFIFVSSIFSQSYQMIKYDIENSKIDTLPLVQFDSSKISDFTDWNYGINNEIELLNLEPPLNTYNNSGFTDLYPAQNYFSINKYPVRTAIKIFRIVNDTLKQRCSGILVSKNYILTDCHCIGEYDSLQNFIFEDSTYIYPAFDNGIENPLWSSTEAEEIVTFKDNMIGSSPSIDIALVKLKDSLGAKNGWMGFGFNDDNSFYENNVFHKLSYPGTVDYSDSTRIFDGDTLFYNYGKLGLIDAGWLGYAITGIKGQSGSSLFYTNNNEYYSVGTQVWSSFSRHIRINRNIFYSFRSIINNSITAITKPNKNIDLYYLADAYPNPFNSSATISFSVPSRTFVTLKVYDSLGREVSTLIDKELPSGRHSHNWNASGLSSNVYFYRLQAGTFMKTKKIILLE